jgi:beta-galactosidase
MPDGRRAWFVFNWGGDEQQITLAKPAADTVTGESVATGTKVSLAGWSTRTFTSG